MLVDSVISKHLEPYMLYEKKGKENNTFVLELREQIKLRIFTQIHFTTNIDQY